MGGIGGSCSFLLPMMPTYLIVKSIVYHCIWCIQFSKVTHLVYHSRELSPESHGGIEVTAAHWYLVLGVRRYDF